MTVQRGLVLEAIRRVTHHTTAEEISRRIRRRGFDVDPSTVYRNLVALDELGYVTHTHFDDRVTRWHRADAQRHGHLVCRRCGAEEEVAIRVLEPLARRLLDGNGFRADLGHSAIVGLCRDCAEVARAEHDGPAPRPDRRRSRRAVG